MKLVPPQSEVDEYRMPLLEHLRELRDHLVIALAAFFVSCVVSFIFAADIFSWLVEPMNLALEERGEGTMAITDPLEGVITYLKVALLAGGFFSSPVLFHQMWMFVAPGLYEQERKVVIPLVVASTTLFLTGAAFGYFVIFEYGFAFFLSVIDLETAAVLSINSYLGTATKLLLAFGLCFQLPVVTYFLARIGLIDHKDMISKFRYAVVGIFLVAAFITPPDPLTQTLMAGPLIFLYTVSIGLVWAVSTKEREPEADAE